MRLDKNIAKFDIFRVDQFLRICYESLQDTEIYDTEILVYKRNKIK